MKIWYSLFNLKAYSGNEPAFYQSDKFYWTELIEANWQEIKSEFDTHLSLNPRFVPLAKKQKVNSHGLWKTMPLMTWGVEFHENICNFPTTTKILNQIPGLVSASFNMLEKNSEIKPHYGETNASVRVHLGLYIPDKLPNVGFKVNGISRSWEKGKILIFCDAYEHSGWNQSNQDRHVLLLDIIKPEFISKKRIICGKVLAILCLQSFKSRIVFMFYLTIIPFSLIHFFALISAIILTPLYNFTGRLKVKFNF